MSRDWAKDIRDMHDKYGFHDSMSTLDTKMLHEYLNFRVRFLNEELEELENAETPEDVVDALIDLCVVAIGTLDLYKIDAHEAWDRVLDANMEKMRGVKPSRPNKYNLPDLIKPEGWVAPIHDDNVGLLVDENGDRIWRDS